MHKVYNTFIFTEYLIQFPYDIACTDVLLRILSLNLLEQDLESHGRSLLVGREAVLNDVKEELEADGVQAVVGVVGEEVGADELEGLEDALGDKLALVNVDCVTNQRQVLCLVHNILLDFAFTDMGV